ncbi:fibrinogen C domain-containing protein 1-like [Penaeus monodon]|uniref:fibrinogen C domain-containing protein 1-like n=1 Tax=Penaeus monodon TaxID=6687 RepID=UPI0018A7AFFF|nr:fibrinogen C domain-containing protein 1-like [Penaeus monodon]
MRLTVVLAHLSVLTGLCTCHHHFETFDAPSSTMDNIAHLVMSLQQEMGDIRKEVRNRMDTMKYELTCEIRNLKEALMKEREAMSGKVDTVSQGMDDFKKRLKRGLRGIGSQNENIANELRSQKAELYAVRNSVYDSREETLTKGNFIMKKVNDTNTTLVSHLDDLRVKLYKINHNLALISGEHQQLMEVVRRNNQQQPKTYNSEDYSDRVLPGCTYTPLDTQDFANVLNRTYMNDSFSGSLGGLDEEEKAWEPGSTEDHQLFPTMPEDCKDDKKKYLEYPPMPRDCKDVFDLGFMEDGIYRIQPPSLSSREVYCDHHTAGGGWTVMVARRKLPRHISFNRTWHEYEVGFGDPSKEYWIGLKALHALTRGRPHQLRADMEDWEGNTAWAAYSFFSVSGEEDKYRLRISGYSGTAGDSLRHSHLQMFSTIDSDNDQENWGSCARGRGGGGWWWGRCACTQPTGQYRRGRYQGPERGVTWWHWKDSNYSLKTLILKIRPLE